MTLHLDHVLLLKGLNRLALESSCVRLSNDGSFAAMLQTFYDFCYTYSLELLYLTLQHSTFPLVRCSACIGLTCVFLRRLKAQTL